MFRGTKTAVLAALLSLSPLPALAHGLSLEPSADPWLTLPLLASGLLYLVGHLRLAFRRQRRSGWPVIRRALLFAGGWLLLVLPVATPLHDWGEESFAAHMIEHEIVMVLAAPLLAMSRPLGILLWGCPGPVRRWLLRAGRRGGLGRLWRRLTDPLVATALQAIVLWGWHVPPAFDAAVASSPLHALQHLTFLASAVLFWWALAYGREGHRGFGMGAFCQFLTVLHTGLLAALLVFARTPWYASYTHQHGSLTPLEDQQLAGLVMWVPAGLVHTAAALALFALWLNGAGRNRPVLWAD